MEETTIDLRDLWRVIVKRKLIIVGITGVFVLLALIMCLIPQKPVNTEKKELYKSTASILIDSSLNSKNENVKDINLLNQQIVKTYGAVASSRTIAEKTIDELNLNIKLDKFRSNLKVGINPDTQIITISYEDIGEHNQQQVLSTYIKNFIQESEKIYSIGKLKVLDEPSKVEKTSDENLKKLTTTTQMNSSEQQPSLNSGKAKNKKLILVISLFLGIMVGFVVVCIIEYMGNTLKKKREIELILGQPTISIIPHNDLNSSECIKEAFRRLRTTLLSRNGNAFIITSPSKRDGKTEASVGLGKTFADAGYKTLIIDANGRNPEVNKIFSIENEEGLSNILNSKIIYELNSKENECNFIRDKIDSFLIETNYNNLYLLSWGTEHINPADLFSKSNLEKLFKELKEDFEYIIIDTPSMGNYSDAQILEKWVDGTIVIAAEGKTNRDEVIRMKEIIDMNQIKILGITWREGEN